MSVNFKSYSYQNSECNDIAALCMPEKPLKCIKINRVQKSDKPDLKIFKPETQIGIKHLRYPY